MGRTEELDMYARGNRLGLLLAALGALVFFAGTAGPRPAQAQSSIISITTDRGQYQPGDPIRICYTVAAAGPITISDTQSDGVSHVFFSGTDDGSGGCLGGTVTPPTGTECLTITSSGPVSRSAQTCFQIGGSVSPGPCIQIYPPPAGCGASISTDQSQYNVGASIRICYSVPGPGAFTITDNQPDGSSHTFFSGVDDGTGGCLGGIVTPPSGTECLQLSASGGSGGSAQACFQVIGQGSGSAGDCGSVSVLGGHVTSSNAQQVESCFYQAYQQCSPATMSATLNGVDAGTTHTFSLQNSSGGCTIFDARQTRVIPRPPGPATTVTCAALTDTGSGLLFSSCGTFGDVLVPAS
jgi:hypothetical protein